MMHQWPNGYSLRWFKPSEFDYPEKMDWSFLKKVDQIRHESGVRLKVTSDFRTREDMARIYAGVPEADWPNSPHQRGFAVDVVPVQKTPENWLRLLNVITQMFLDGRLPGLGLEVATKHIHIDQDTELRRPHFWVGKSR